MGRVLAAALVALSALVAAPPVSAHTPIEIRGFAEPSYDPPDVTRNIGARFVWTNADVVSHTATHSGPFRIWDSGLLEPGDSYTKIVRFAGTYPSECTPHPSMTAILRVRPGRAPRSGPVGTEFTITIASIDASPGRRYDVQIRVGDGAWTTYRRGVVSRTVTFEPSAPGTYWFRSRVRRTSDGAAVRWSPAMWVNVA